MTNKIKEKLNKNNLIFNLAIPGQSSIDILNKFELVDGLHPNDIGHEKISELVLKELYKEK